MPTWACILEDPQNVVFEAQRVVDPPQVASVHLANRRPRDLDLRAWIEHDGFPFTVEPADRVSCP